MTSEHIRVSSEGAYERLSRGLVVATNTVQWSNLVAKSLP